MQGGPEVDGSADAGAVGVGEDAADEGERILRQQGDEDDAERAVGGVVDLAVDHAFGRGVGVDDEEKDSPGRFADVSAEGVLDEEEEEGGDGKDEKDAGPFSLVIRRRRRG